MHVPCTAVASIAAVAGAVIEHASPGIAERDVLTLFREAHAHDSDALDLASIEAQLRRAKIQLLPRSAPAAGVAPAATPPAPGAPPPPAELSPVGSPAGKRGSLSGAMPTPEAGPAEPPGADGPGPGPGKQRMTLQRGGALLIAAQMGLSGLAGENASAPMRRFLAAQMMEAGELTPAAE